MRFSQNILREFLPSPIRDVVLPTRFSGFHSGGIVIFSYLGGPTFYSTDLKNGRVGPCRR
jgi:hypothetical protein